MSAATLRDLIAWAALRLLYPRAMSGCAGIAILRLDDTANSPRGKDGRPLSLQASPVASVGCKR